MNINEVRLVSVGVITSLIVMCKDSQLSCFFEFACVNFTIILSLSMTHYHSSDIYVHIYIYIKNFAWEDQRRKQCYILHIAPQGVKVLYYLLIEPDMHMAKNWKAFIKGFSQPFCWIR